MGGYAAVTGGCKISCVNGVPWQAPTCGILAASVGTERDDTMVDKKRGTQTAQDRRIESDQLDTSSAPISMPSVERVQQELARATSIDDFFGKQGIFARLFANTLEQMLQAELTVHLGYQPYAVEGRNSGNSRNSYESASCAPPMAT
jgi:hypothetical protein